MLTYVVDLSNFFDRTKEIHYENLFSENYLIDQIFAMCPHQHFWYKSTILTHCSHNIKRISYLCCVYLKYCHAVTTTILWIRNVIIFWNNLECINRGTDSSSFNEKNWRKMKKLEIIERMEFIALCFQFFMLTSIYARSFLSKDYWYIFKHSG